GDALQAPRGRLAESGGKIRDDQKVIFFGHAAGLQVVLGDRRELVAQVHLDDLFDVFAEFAKPLVDLLALGPDAAVDDALLVIGDMHEAGEVFAEADGVEDGKGDLPGRRGREEAKDDVVDRADDRAAA